LHEEVVRMSDEYGFHYLIQKVPAGFLTNFDTLVTTISSMNEKRAFIETDNYASLTKKEQASIKRQLAKTEKVYA
jgi:ribosomal protein S2